MVKTEYATPTGRLAMSPVEARRIIGETLPNANAEPNIEIQQVSVTDDGFSFLRVNKGFDKPDIVRHSYRFPELHAVEASHSSFYLPGYWYVTLPGDLDLYWRQREGAEPFAKAINAILYHASPQRLTEDAAEFEAFKERARTWRALQDKPAISEEVRRYRVMAEDSFRNKKFDEAIHSYEAGLDLCPFWPDGHFNAALLCAEVGMYGPAVAHMKRYLALVPDAPDARTAQDKLYVWEGKLGRSQVHGAPAGDAMKRWY